MNPDAPYCTHEAKRLTKRTLSNGSTVVYEQCVRCGSGRAVSKSCVTNWDTLPEWDVGLSDRFWTEYRAQQHQQFEHERDTRTGEFWERYKPYLESEHWKFVRTIVLKRDPICQVCFNFPSTQAHHLSYESFKKWGVSFAIECVGVCNQCHNQLHSDHD